MTTETPTTSLSQALPVDAIALDVSAEDWRAAVTAAGEALAASGAATRDYTAEMIAAVEEYGPYIVIAPGIALAHSRPSPAVRRVGLSWVRLAEPVAFGDPDNDPVSLVVGLCSPDATSHTAALAQVASLLSDEERMAQLAAAGTPEEVRAIVLAFERDHTWSQS